MKYVALLRGINVGGNNKIRMVELRNCLEIVGFTNVTTYIQSGNILFESQSKNKHTLEATIEQAIKSTFGLTVPAIVLTAKELRHILENVPAGWMKNPSWKYNYLFIKSAADMGSIIKGIGVLKPDIEEIVPGKQVIYQSMLFSKFGQTTTGKLASSPVYKQISIRNHNTVQKLARLAEEN